MHKGRLEAFSDGVIAIIITIMVLEIKVPHGTFFTALGALVIAVPLSVAAALFISEYAPRWLAGPVGTMIELLAAIPSVRAVCVSGAKTEAKYRNFMRQKMTDSLAGAQCAKLRRMNPTDSQLTLRLDRGDRRTACVLNAGGGIVAGPTSDSVRAVPRLPACY